MISKILKGIAIGIANVIPGVSGGTIALLLGVYEDLIGGFGDLFTHPISAIKRLWSLLLGVGLGILLSLFTIDYLLAVAPIPTTVFFVGLILGGLGPINTELPKKPWGMIERLIVLLSIAIVVALPLIVIGTGGAPSATSLNPFILFLMGVIGAATMVVPGVSGSMVLLILGYYQPIIGLISSFIASVLALDISLVLSLFIPLLGFALGIAVGLVGISKLLTFLLKKQRDLTFLIIYGLLLGSPLAILIQVDFSTSTPWMIASAVVTLLLGIAAASYLSKIEK